MSKTPEQQRAIESIKQNTSVIAGAGSGKTMVLVERFLHLLSSGTDCAKILAITFTNKAASEMRERIVKQINAKIADTSLDAGFWQKAKADLSKCYIGTIHGLCINIISQYPLQVGINPNFSVVDESDASLLLQKCVQKCVKGLVEQKDLSILTLLDSYGYSDLCINLKQLVPSFSLDDVQRDDFEDFLTSGHKNYAEKLPQFKVAFLESLNLLIANKENLKKSAHKENIEILSSQKEHILAAVKDLPEDLTKLDFLQDVIKPLKAQSADKQLVLDVKESLQQLIACTGDFLAMKIAVCWAKVIKKVVEQYADFKNKNGLLDFSDFENLTYKLLSTNPLLVKQLNKDYDHIMVDEFQDTNNLQKSILYYLAGGQEKTLHGKKLFIVGDDNQSIYRFRGADVSVFAAVREDIEKTAGEQIELLQNFRSTSGIINVCNDVFTNLLGRSYNKLICGKSNFTTSVDAEILQEDENTTDADLLAQRFKKLHSQGYQYKDMAILFRTKTRLNDYCNSLKAYGIDFCILDGQGFYQAQEIIDVLNLLRFLDNKLKDSCLIGALRSPLFGLNDNSLTFIALAGDSECFWDKMCLFDQELLEKSQADLFSLAKTRIEYFLHQADILSFGALLRILFETLKISQLCSSYPDFEQRYANLEKLIDLVFTFEQEQGGTLTEFLNYVDELISIDSRQGLEQIQNQDSNALKILTVHKSKGLQFKIVALPDCAAGFFSDKSNIVYNNEQGLALRPKDNYGRLMNSLFLSNLKQLEKQENIKEMQRLFYVAMTRAEEKIIFTRGDREKIAGDSWWSWLQSSFDEQDDFWVGKNSKIAIVKVDKEELSSNYIKQLKQGICLDDVLSLVNSEFSVREHIDFSATSLRDYLHCPRLFYYKYILNIAEFFDVTTTSVPGYIVGLFVHNVLTNLTGFGFDKAFALSVEKYSDINKEELLEIKQWFIKYINGDLFRGLKIGNCFYEKSFNLPLIDGNSFVGSIDCVQVVGDDINIVDFKTDRQISNLTGYEYQLFIYALAAEKLYKDKRINSIALHFVRLNKEISFDYHNKKAEFTVKIVDLCEQIKAKKEERDFLVNPENCEFCGYNYFCLK